MGKPANSGVVVPCAKIIIFAFAVEVAGLGSLIARVVKGIAGELRHYAVRVVQRSGEPLRRAGGIVIVPWCVHSRVARLNQLIQGIYCISLRCHNISHLFP